MITERSMLLKTEKEVPGTDLCSHWQLITQLRITHIQFMMLRISMILEMVSFLQLLIDSEIIIKSDLLSLYESYIRSVNSLINDYSERIASNLI
jgi:hypothetical protein